MVCLRSVWMHKKQLHLHVHLLCSEHVLSLIAFAFWQSLLCLYDRLEVLYTLRVDLVKCMTGCQEAIVSTVPAICVQT